MERADPTGSRLKKSVRPRRISHARRDDTGMPVAETCSGWSSWLAMLPNRHLMNRVDMNGGTIDHGKTAILSLEDKK